MSSALTKKPAEENLYWEPEQEGQTPKIQLPVKQPAQVFPEAPIKTTLLQKASFFVLVLLAIFSIVLIGLVAALYTRGNKEDSNEDYSGNIMKTTMQSNNDFKTTTAGTLFPWTPRADMYQTSTEVELYDDEEYGIYGPGSG